MNENMFWVDVATENGKKGGRKGEEKSNDWQTELIRGSGFCLEIKSGKLTCSILSRTEISLNPTQPISRYRLCPSSTKTIRSPYWSILFATNMTGASQLLSWNPQKWIYNKAPVECKDTSQFCVAMKTHKQQQPTSTYTNKVQNTLSTNSE